METDQEYQEDDFEHYYNAAGRLSGLLKQEQEARRKAEAQRDLLRAALQASITCPDLFRGAPRTALREIEGGDNV